MSVWWEATAETPRGKAEKVFLAENAEAAAKFAQKYFSREYPGADHISVKPYADEENDETVGGFDEKGELPQPATSTIPRLTT